MLTTARCFGSGREMAERARTDPYDDAIEANGSVMLAVADGAHAPARQRTSR